jgi:hypothetical protein
MSESGKSKADMVYKTTLKKTYGLTDGMIRRLGPPDKEVPNPRYRSLTSTLYNRSRVEAFIEEIGDEYQHHLRRHMQRSLPRRHPPVVRAKTYSKLT